MTINDIVLNVGDRNKLKKYENFLETALYHGYITGLTMQAKIELEAVYSKYFTEKLSMGCNSCVLKMCKSLGNIYFNKKGERV